MIDHFTRTACRPALLLLALAGPLTGCDPSQRMTQDDRDAVTSCRKDADRQFAAQNRYLLSERGDQSAPLSGNSLPYNPNAGLSDQYQADQLTDACLARSAAGPAVVPGTLPSK